MHTLLEAGKQSSKSGNYLIYVGEAEETFKNVTVIAVPKNVDAGWMVAESSAQT